MRRAGYESLVVMSVVMDFFNKICCVAIFKFLFLGFGLASCLHANDSAIILGPIEGELAKKQIPIDLGRTPKALIPLVSKPIYLHGGLRLATEKESQFSATFGSAGLNKIQVSITRGNPKSSFSEYTVSSSSLESAVFLACDRLVLELLKIPGFFSGRLSYISDVSRAKEILISDALMTYARPQTSFGKIAFNPSWNNSGAGIFFTSNRKVFNNVYHLDLATRKVATVANYKGSNLCAVQNPRSSQTALILSTSGNPELWLAGAPYERPRRVTKNKSNESGPCWSPDGRRLILTSDSRGKPQLYEVSLSSGVLSRIPTNVSSHCVEAAWNPLDSSKIAFTAAVGGGFQIFEYDFSKRTSRMITRGRDHAMQPCWANDGRHLFFTSRSSGGATRIMLVDTEFEEATPISLHDRSFGNCSQPSFFYYR
jgi:TolB protein